MKPLSADTLAVVIHGIKEEVRAKGYLIRLTEWDEGFQTVAVRARDHRKVIVSPWFKTERDGWDWLLEVVTWVHHPAQREFLTLRWKDSQEAAIRTLEAEQK